ncbi:MAG TPA: hypothetical protein VLM37_13140 [Fibrobacteraceae bacterium]|nr:hypothetical protein [Fibrobacteraceae bacterium]
MSQERIAELRQRVLDLRRKSTLPWWRLSYAEFLLDRAVEYIAVQREPETAGMLERVTRWLAQQESLVHAAGYEDPQTRARQRFQRFRVEDLQRQLGELRADLTAKKYLIPRPERESLLARLDRTEGLLREGHGEEVKAELLAVRVAWIRRQTRSYRAWSIAQPFRENPRRRTPKVSLHPSGPYNNRNNLEDLVTLVSERDPIWVEDFIEVYNNLFQYAERLSDPDRKKKKGPAP